MTDLEIVDGLKRKDPFITSFFMKKYRPLFLHTIRLVFDTYVDEDECINELYLYLMKDNASKLESFEGRSSLGGWMKIVVIRFFRNLKISHKVIEDISVEPLYEKKNEDEADVYTNDSIDAKNELEYYFSLMKNERYVSVIRMLMIEDEEPTEVAQRMGITVANLYNIKKRAIESLAKIAIRQRRIYDNKK